MSADRKWVVEKANCFRATAKRFLSKSIHFEKRKLLFGKINSVPAKTNSF